MSGSRTGGAGGEDALRAGAVEALVAARPELEPAVPGLLAAAGAIVAAARRDRMLWLCGNGGSFADALHIAGELKKAFERPRPLPAHVADRLAQLPGGSELAGALHAGVRAMALGADPVLASAADNDIALRHAGLAQELVAVGQAGDVLLAISTSGRSPNVCNAAVVARALDIGVVALGGSGPSPLAELADVVVTTPAVGTAAVQGLHREIYHALCRVVEDTLFG